ncbi:hypothetical protein KAT73_04435 [candidate division WOR-3 bacterium]|nr:hypothetical protein [candidate division WOR-3 bacterium]
MTKTKTISGYETIDMIKKRLELLMGAKLRPKKRISDASHKIDELREKYGDIEKGYNSVKIIRRWRDSR